MILYDKWRLIKPHWNTKM